MELLFIIAIIIIIAKGSTVVLVGIIGFLSLFIREGFKVKIQENKYNSFYRNGYGLFNIIFSLNFFYIIYIVVKLFI